MEVLGVAAGLPVPFSVPGADAIRTPWCLVRSWVCLGLPGFAWVGKAVGEACADG